MKVLENKNNNKFAILFLYVKSLGYTQGEIAEKIGINEASLSNYIKGRSIPNIEIIQKLCIEFNIPDEIIVNYFKNNSISSEKTDTIDDIDIVTIIQKLKSLGYTQKEISLRIGVTELTISNYMSGRSTPRKVIIRDLLREFNEELNNLKLMEETNPYIIKYSKLTSEHKEVINKMIDIYIEDEHKEYVKNKNNQFKN